MSSSSSQPDLPPGVSPRHPNAYPPNSYESVTVWYLSLNTYLLFTLIVIQLASLWRHSRGSFQAKRPGAAREPIPAPDTTRPSPWMPKFRMAWKDPNQETRETLQAPGGTFRLEIDFNERDIPQQQPQPTIQVNTATAEARTLRFGVEGNLAPIQELEASRITMPGSPHPRLRGGSLPTNNSNTNRRHEDREMSTEDRRDNTTIDRPQRLLLSYHLTIEDLLEAIVWQFAELERHRDGSLLREALTGNERRRLIRLYRELEYYMRNFGVEIDGAEPDGTLGERSSRSGRRVAGEQDRHVAA